MDLQLADTLKAWFESYVDSFRNHADSGQGKADLQPLLQIKYDHSYRVARESLGIARKLNWRDEEIRMAEIIGLFHDVGRFSQFTEFKTFRDCDSVDHGNRSAEDLFRLGTLAGCSESERQIILDSIKNHNKLAVSEDLSGESRRFVNLVRDADKLDIFYVMSNAVKTRSIGEFPEIILNLPVEGFPSENILNDLKLRRLSSYTNAKNLVDLALIQLSWLYELSYFPSYLAIEERNVINDILESVPDSSELREAGEILRKYVAEKCGYPK